MSDNWNTSNIPDQSGRVAIVTGANTGIGFAAARALAQKQAQVILAGRNPAKGKDAINAIKREYPNAQVEWLTLDLANLKSIHTFADNFLATHRQLDLLINNAGIMMCPFANTNDGFEIQFGTNHLGHFALTGLMLPTLKETSGSRIVLVSSLAHRGGQLDFSDLNWQQRSYDTSQAYCDSKQANLLFAHSLCKKLQGCDQPMVTAAHPGWTKTELQRHALKYRLMGLFMAQKPAMGALPTLRAALDPDADPGDFFGPSDAKEMRGPPIKVAISQNCSNDSIADQLWLLSEEMTGLCY